MTVTVPTVRGPWTPAVKDGGSGVPTSGFASRLWRLAGGAEPQCSHRCSGDPVVPTGRGGVRRCARVPGWHVGARGGLSDCYQGATECIVVTPPPPPGGPGYNERPSRGNPPGAGGSPGFSQIKLRAGLGGTGRKSAESVKSGGRRSTWGRLWKSPQKDSRRLLGGCAPPATFLSIDSKLLNKGRSRTESLAARLPRGAQPGSLGRDRAPAGRAASGCAGPLHCGEAGGSSSSLAVPLNGGAGPTGPGAPGPAALTPRVSGVAGRAN